MYACVWCGQLIKQMPVGFNPKKQEIVCSPECGQREQWFRMSYCDDLYINHIREQFGEAKAERHPSPQGKT